MAEKKERKPGTKKERVLTERDLMKYEIAEELGLMDKVRESGWKGLTARESGQIGGIMTKRMREKRNNARF